MIFNPFSVAMPRRKIVNRVLYTSAREYFPSAFIESCITDAEEMISAFTSRRIIPSRFPRSMREKMRCC